LAFLADVKITYGKNNKVGSKDILENRLGKECRQTHKQRNTSIFPLFGSLRGLNSFQFFGLRTYHLEGGLS